MVECEIVCAVAGEHGEGGAEEHRGGECHAGMYVCPFVVFQIFWVLWGFFGFLACLVQMTPMVFWVFGIPQFFASGSGLILVVE